MFIVNCWPSETSQGCDVNIEYTLEDEQMELRDVSILVPLPAGVTPVVGECDGEYKHDRGKSALTWTIPMINSSNKVRQRRKTNNGNLYHYLFFKNF